MKFVIKQEKLEYMLEKLLVKDMVPSSVISVKDGKMFSIQKEEKGRSLRFLKLQKEFFEEIDEKANESIQLDIAKFLKNVKLFPPKEKLECEVIGSVMSIKGEVRNPKLTIESPRSEVMTKLPFNIEGNIPTVTDDQGAEIKLDVKVTVDVAEFREIIRGAEAIGTEFYEFTDKDGKFLTVVGDLNSNEKDEFFPKSILKGKDFKAVYTYGMQQIGATFDKEVNINMANNAPAWVYETSKEHLLGVFIPPFMQED